MKSSTRYTLIAFGFFVFIILAPLLILYVSGRTLNFDSRDTNETGIFDAKSNPTDADLYIDGKKHSSTPAIARFLPQGEYEFTLKKDGYYDWSKRLPIESGQVNYAQVGVDEVQLMKKSEPLVIEPAGVSKFRLIGDRVWYPFGNTIVSASVNDPKQKKTVPNLTIDTIDMTPLRDSKHLWIRGMEKSIILNTENNSYFEQPLATSHIEVTSNGLAIFTQNNVLLSLAPGSNQTTDVMSDVKAFALLDNTGYFFKTNGVISSAVWNGSAFTDEQLILNNIPVSPDESELIITDRKELFLKNGKTGLYRVGQSLELIAGQVESVNLEPRTNELSFISSGGLSFYNFISSRPQLLTRTTTPSNAFLIHSNIGYGFIGNVNGLEAIEIDTRGQQNRYQLLSGKQVWQLVMTANQKTIVALVDGSLVSVEIRN